MASKAERGTKRTCQNPACGARFYDLSRDPISCPVCGTVYELALSSMASAAAGAGGDRARRPAKKPEYVAPKEAPLETPDVEGEDALVDVEGAGEPIAAGEDETFLEADEEDGGDVSGIISGGGEGEEEA
jgi:uncharacterized protein (TIGR02300 family)